MDIDANSSMTTLLETAHHAAIAPAHREAAINAICSVLYRKDDPTLVLADADDQLLCRAFDIVFDRSNVTKGKVMRQLLVLLVSRTALRNQNSKQAVLDKVLRKTFTVLSCLSEQSKAKAALQVLSALLNKNVIGLEQLAASYFASHNQSTDITLNSVRLDETCKVLLKTVLYWTKNRDAAHAVGNTIELLVRRWKALQSKFDSGNAFERLPVWASVLAESISCHPDDLSNYKSHIFPGLFMVDIPDYIAFLQYLGLNHVFGNSRIHKTTELVDGNGFVNDLLCTSLQVGKEVGLIIESDSANLGNFEFDGKSIIFPDAAFTRLLSRASSAVRIAGLSLVVASTSITRPMTRNSLESIKRNLFHLFAETDAHVRGEILGLVPRLLERIRAASTSLSKAIHRAGDDHPCLVPSELTDPTAVLHSHQEYIRWLLRFLSAGLRPGAPYQRHISCLKALLILAKSAIDQSISHNYWIKQASGEIIWPFRITTFTPWVLRSLLDLAMDPFDDVRSLAVTLLEMSSLSTTEPDIGLRKADVYPIPCDHSPIDLITFIERAEELMLSTSRADHADGVSRAYALLFAKTENDPSLPACGTSIKGKCWCTRLGICQYLIASLQCIIEVGERDLSLAVQRFPLHGTLAGFRYIIDSKIFYQSIQDSDLGQEKLWHELHASLIGIFQRVWNCVRDVLCNDAPEGHVPEDLDPESDIDTKDILSYSWRALKEASSLLRSIVTQAPIIADRSAQTDGVGLDVNELLALTRLSFTELAELRHRGAFSAVAQAFAACCKRCDDANRQDILDVLYADSLACVRLQGSKITRRSAGIPSMIVGILSADTNGYLFETAMADLKIEAEAPAPPGIAFGDPLPQIHALNCLRVIFTSTFLSGTSERYITRTLKLAANCLNSNVWAVRNCGLMLFKALIDRLLGTTTSQNWSDSLAAKTSKFSFADAPDLLHIIVKLLQPISSPDLASSAFESVFPALKIIQRIPLPEERRSDVRDLVLHLCGSPHWHLRELAAKTYLTLLDTRDTAKAVAQLLPTLNLPQNAIHGRLLCIRCLVKKTRSIDISNNGTWSKLFMTMTSSHAKLYCQNHCPITKAAFVDILNLLLIRCPSAQKLEHIDIPDMQFYLGLRISPALIRAEFLHAILRSLRYYEGSSSLTHIDNIFGSLVANVPNLCTTVLQDLAHALNVQPALGNSEYLPRILLRMGAATEDDELAAVAYDLLATVLERQSVDVEHLANMSTLPLDIIGRWSKVPSPAAAAAAVRVSGTLLDALCTPNAFAEEVFRTLQRLLYRIRMMINANSPFDQRYAAVYCLDRFRNLWDSPQVIDRYDKIFAQALLLVYDSLNDDDEEIRALAASTARRVLVARTKVDVEPETPLVASRRISNLLVEFLREDDQLVVKAIQRLCGSRLTAGTLTPSAAERLQAARQGATALFAVEKQNLFVDNVREAVIWSRVLKRMPKKAITRDHAQALSAWVTEGLESLTIVAGAEKDRPLGWTSKQDVFVLGMQVILAADVLLHWRRVSLRGPVRGSSLRLLLWRLAEAGSQNGLHGMWLKMINQTLQRSILENVGRVGGVLTRVEGKLLA